MVYAVAHMLAILALRNPGRPIISFPRCNIPIPSSMFGSLMQFKSLIPWVPGLSLSSDACSPVTFLTGTFKAFYWQSQYYVDLPFGLWALKFPILLQSII